MMQCSRKLKVTDLNPHLICVLCGGYFVDATTIIECLHSFCRSCIVRYLETNKYCPICDVQVHKTRPLQNIRPDDTLQTIVYKLVPGLYQNEMRCRRDFYTKHPEAKAQVLPEARGEHTDQSRIFLPDEPVSLCLEYVGAPNNSQSDQPGTWGRRYLRCPAAVSVVHLHKLIRAKFGLAMGHRVDVFYKDDMLPDNWTLMDIAYIYQWKRKNPIHLSYQILESQRKRIKLSHDSVSSVQLVPSEMETTAGENNISKCVDNPKQASSEISSSKSPADSSHCSDAMAVDNPVAPVASAEATLSTNTTVVDALNKTSVEWKEVQLQISENGIMSVAGVENDRLLTPLQPISVSSQSDDTENVVKTVSVDEKQSENKVPPVDSDSNTSALQDKKVNAVKCDSRTKPSETTTKNVDDDVTKSDNVKEVEAKALTKDTNNHIDSFQRSNKPAVGYKLPNSCDKTNAIFKSKTDKLEDTVRNIASRTEPAGKAELTSKSTHVLTAAIPSKEVVRQKASNSESGENVTGNVHRPLTSTPKVYPGIKPPIYNSLPKEEHVKVNNSKLDPLGSSGIKQTPMEILNTQNKLQNHMVKYKSHRASIKPWNPSISRAAVLAMKHASPQSLAATSKEGGSTENQQLNPPPVKQPRFFKIRNMPRFLGNPASGVKPMYQVAPGSEIVAGNASAPTSTTTAAASSVTVTNSSNNQATVAVTTTSDTNLTNNCAITTASSSATNTTTGAAFSTQKISKVGGSGLTLMKIDPKTLSPITINPVNVSHVLNNPPRTSPSTQLKKLPPPFTPGSPKHSNHYTNCRTAHTNGSKNTVPRTPSPAHTGGLIPTHPFIPVSHTSPHLLYGAFPNPFSPTDPSGNRLLAGPNNSELIRAMSALCSSGSAFHPSLPPSISMLFNPHHAHHRPLQTERSGFKCNSNDKKSTQPSPPTVQRVPPTNPSSKGFNETDNHHINMNAPSCNSEQSSNSLRPKKSKTEHPSSPTLPVKNAKNAPSNTSLVSPSSASTFSSAKKGPTDSSPRQQPSLQNDSQLMPNNAVSISNCTVSDSKKSVSSSLPKLPGEKIEEISSELTVQNQKVENKTDCKTNCKEVVVMTEDSSGNKNSCNSDNLIVNNKDSVNNTVNNNNEIKNINETKPKDDEQFNSINNNNNINKNSQVSTGDKSVVDSSVVNNNNV